MNSEIISVGTELLLGDVVNTNAAYISKKLMELGINCYYHSVVGDNPQRLKDMFELSLKRSDIVFLTGGLGPTYDDMTKEVVGEVLGEKLVFDQNSYDLMLSRFSHSNRKMGNNNLKQAYIYENGHALRNDLGTAPGVYIKKNGKIVILLPGPPNELKGMFEKQVMPYFVQTKESVLVSKRVYCIGIGESDLEMILESEMKNYTNPTLAPYSDADGLYIRVTALGKDASDCLELINPVLNHIHEVLGEYIYSVDIPRIEDAFKEIYKGDIVIFENRTFGILSHRLETSLTHGININKQDLNIKQQLETLINQYPDSMIVVFEQKESKGHFEVLVSYKGKTDHQQLYMDRGYVDDSKRTLKRASSRVLKMMMDMVV